MLRRSAPLLAALWLTACRSDPGSRIRAEPHPLSTSTTSVTPPAASNATAPEIDGANKVTDPVIAGALRAWVDAEGRTAAREGEQLRVRILSATSSAYLNALGSRAEIVLVEHLQGGDACREETVVVEIDHDMSKPSPEVKDNRVGADCCGGATCEDRPPMGWMFDYVRALGEQDPAALRQLIDPVAGLKEVDRELGARTIVAGRVNAAMVRGLTLIRYTSQLSCGAFGDDGHATCSAYGGGWEGVYTWKRAGKGAYLVEIYEKSH